MLGFVELFWSVVAAAFLSPFFTPVQMAPGLLPQKSSYEHKYDEMLTRTLLTQIHIHLSCCSKS